MDIMDCLEIIVDDLAHPYTSEEVKWESMKAYPADFSIEFQMVTEAVVRVLRLNVCIESSLLIEMRSFE